MRVSDSTRNDASPCQTKGGCKFRALARQLLEPPSLEVPSCVVSGCPAIRLLLVAGVNTRTTVGLLAESVAAVPGERARNIWEASSGGQGAAQLRGHQRGGLVVLPKPAVRAPPPDAEDHGLRRPTFDPAQKRGQHHRSRCVPPCPGHGGGAATWWPSLTCRVELPRRRRTHAAHGP
jgi:hypothetical protein